MRAVPSVRGFLFETLIDATRTIALVPSNKGAAHMLFFKILKKFT